MGSGKMGEIARPSTEKDTMKKTPTATKKAPATPRVECHATVYSERALQMMEQATGQRYARPTPVVRPAAAPATDAD